MRSVVALGVCLGLLLMIAGCDPLTDRQYINEGAGIDLNSSKLVTATTRQNEYIDQVCRQAGYTSAKPRFAQMVAIKACMANKQFTKIPQLIRDMKVLWPDSAGLQDRREREAAFFEAGLARMAGN
jgi:hypothetical protein